MNANRLPGVYFETAAPSIPEALPRMDIPAFVGFAASGPLDTPVPVEDTARFHEIFGHDQQLAWDLERGQMACAQLPPAVRAFFRNGGRRCWIVRVADNDTAVSNQFMLPGMLAAGPGSDDAGIWMEARSPGSWSDDLRLNATLTFTPLPVSTTMLPAPPSSPSGPNHYQVLLRPGIPAPVTAGDLLQLVFSGAQATPVAPADAVAYLPIQSVISQPFVPGPNVRPIPQAALNASSGFWFRPAVPQDFPALSSPSVPDSFGVVQLPLPRAAQWLTCPAPLDLSVLGWGLSSEPQEFVIELARSVADGIRPGTWLRLEFNAPDLPAGALALLLLVEGTHGASQESNAPLSSPAAGQETALVTAAAAWWSLDESQALLRFNSQPEVRAIDLELWVLNAQSELTRLRDLGLAPPQSRYLGYLPTDARLFTPSDRPETPPGAGLRAEAAHPRFPMSAPPGAGAAIYLPLGVPGFPKDEFYQSALPKPGSALERDGLAPAGISSHSYFTAGYFLDPDLGDSSLSSMLTEAFHKQYQFRRSDKPGPLGEPLLKMHSVIPVQEASLLTVPDAIHRGWFQVGGQTPTSLAAPRLIAISIGASGEITLTWTSVADASSYTLQQSSDPLFVTSAVVWEGSAQHSSPLPQRNSCPARSYFRVRAQGLSGAGPWSNTLTGESPLQAFEACSPDTIDAPMLHDAGDHRGQITLMWNLAAAGISSYRLQVAYDPSFDFPQLLYEGTKQSFRVWGSHSRSSYFRVSAQRGNQSSPWSNTVAVSGENSDPQWQMVPSGVGTGCAACEDELRTIHQAMLRMCAARADMFALLALPQGYHTTPALDYQASLLSIMSPEETGHVLSFGALYHPWLVVRDGSDNSAAALRFLVPDGTVCGCMADRTLSVGAWVAAANRVLTGVADLDPHLEENAAQQFFPARLNLIRQEPRGFLCSSSFTLSTENELFDITVRRLLILLRRLAQRDGAEFVFQSNTTGLRYAVQRRFQDILANLFMLGAFAGDTQDEGFRVVTDSAVNLPETVDQGRFIVELRVAPSLPLEFLTVRLVQTGGEILLTEEF